MKYFLDFRWTSSRLWVLFVTLALSTSVFNIGGFAEVFDEDECGETSSSAKAAEVFSEVQLNFAKVKEPRFRWFLDLEVPNRKSDVGSRNSILLNLFVDSNPSHELILPLHC